MKYDSIIFDFDSTLVDYHYGDNLALSKIISLLPVKIDYEEFINYSIDVIHTVYNKRIKMEGSIHKYRLKNTIEHFGLSWEDIYLNEYLAVYLNIVKPFEGVPTLLEKLSKNIKIGVLTNSIDITEQKKRIETSKLSPYFNKIGIAAEIGYEKPNKEIFYWIVNKLDSKIENCIFIGDSEHYDIIGAKNVGLRCIKKVTSQTKETIAHDKFYNFLELEKILKSKYEINL